MYFSNVKMNHKLDISDFNMFLVACCKINSLFGT